MYFIYGEEQYLIDKKIKEITKKNSETKIVFLDSDISIDQSINEILTFSIFDSTKIIVFKNIQVLIKNNERDANKLIDALKNKIESTTVVFVLNKVVEKQKNDFITFLKKEAICFEFNTMKDKELSIYIKDYITQNNGIISEINLFYLLSKLPHKLIFIIKEIDKLLSFDKNITRKNIDDLVPKYDTSKAFDFINAFSDQNIEQIFKIYYEKINQGELTVSLISQISNVLEMCSQIHAYKKLGKSNDEIAHELNKHPFVIKKNTELLNSISYKRVEEYLIKLSELDLNIKQNKIDEKIGFENFLLNIVNNK